MNVNKTLTRIHAGFYAVGDNWYVERITRGKWQVKRFKENSEIVEKTYDFDSYAEARDHAIMEHCVKLLCTEE